MPHVAHVPPFEDQGFKEYHRLLDNVTACGFICPENVACSLGFRKIKTLYSNASSQQIFLIYPNVDQVITLYFASRRLNTIEVGAFTNFVKLEVLFVHENKLTVVYPGRFSYMKIN